jgi:hypothetical protein
MRCASKKVDGSFAVKKEGKGYDVIGLFWFSNTI